MPRPAPKAFLEALAKSPGSAGPGPRVRSVPKAKLRQKESPIVAAILKALKLKGFFCWRNNSGLTVLPEQGSHGRRVIKGGEAGSPDIFLVVSKQFTPIRRFTVEGNSEPREPIPLALLCGLEVKTDIGKQSPTQRVWQAKAERHGVRYAVVRSVSEALEIVRKWSGQ